MNQIVGCSKIDARGRVRTARRMAAQQGLSLAQRRAWFAALSVTAANVQFSSGAQFADGIAGTTVTAGQWLYKNDGTGQDGRLYLADADASVVTANVVGVAAHGAAAGQPLRYCTDDPDFTPGGTLSLSAAADSAVYVLSATAGSAAPMDDLANGLYPVVLFIAKSTTKAVLRIVKQLSATVTA